MKLSSKLVSFTLAASVILGISSMASAGGGMEGHGGGFGGWGHSSNSMRLIADLTPVSPYKIGQGEFRFVASTSGSNIVIQKSFVLVKWFILRKNELFQ
jgi:hypothetical protein